MALAGCGGGGDVSADVTARNVLGSYTAFVSNSSDTSVEVVCTVTASTGDTDTFSLSLGPGESVEHEAKMPLSDFTEDLEIECV